jgi:hypothetical protein
MCARYQLAKRPFRTELNGSLCLGPHWRIKPSLAARSRCPCTSLRSLPIMIFKPLAVIATLALALHAGAQTIEIGAPASGQHLKPGDNFTAEIDRPVGFISHRLWYGSNLSFPLSHRIAWQAVKRWQSSLPCARAALSRLATRLLRRVSLAAFCTVDRTLPSSRRVFPAVSPVSPCGQVLTFTPIFPSSD